jgi:uncharacterized membrane protein
MLEMVAVRSQGAHSAERALAGLRAGGDDPWLSEVSVIERDADGRYSVKAKSPHLDRDTAAAGAAIGGLTGVFVGLIGGPIGFVLWTALGAITGGAIGAHRQSAFRPAIESLKDMLPPDASMLVLVADDDVVGALVDATAPTPNDVLRSTLTPDQIDELEGHHRDMRGAGSMWSEEETDGAELPPQGPAQTYGA